MSRRKRSGVCTQRDKASINFRLIRFWIFLIVGFSFRGIASDSTPPLVAEQSEKAESPELVIAKGFKVEKVYTVPSEQGSWISLAVDPSGRLIASAQSGLLYRITLGKGLEVPLVEPIRVFVKDKSGKEVGKPVGSAQGLLWAFESLYVVINGASGLGSGLYRVRSEKSDGDLDHVDFLASLPGGGEHGPHGVTVDPGGKFLYVTAGNDCGLPKWQFSKVSSHWGGDQLLSPKTQSWEWHTKNGVVPGGWVVRTDPEGKKWEIYCSGLRNTYRLAFNPEGELFTCDGDNEWQVGLPWYRAPRICHVTGGGDFGWRSGRLKWPTYFPDGLSSVVDLPKGGPSSVVMGTGAKFPAKYQRALYALDWAYGRIYAAHLIPMGSSYSASLELFLSGRPLAVADAVVGKDGALYFVVGGRSIESGLYRITYVGSESTEPISNKADETDRTLRQLRHTMESLQAPNPRAVEMAWPVLGSKDERLRATARVVLEHQNPNTWKDRLLKEIDPQKILTAAIAFARCGAPSDQVGILQKLDALDWNDLSSRQRIELLRAYSLAFIRMGRPSTGSAAKVLARLKICYPAKNNHENCELSRLLVYLRSPDVIDKSLSLLEKASLVEDKMHYIWLLDTVQEGWSEPRRQTYVRLIERVDREGAGSELQEIISRIRGRNGIRHLNQTPLTISERAAVQAEAWQSRNPINWTMKEILPTVKAEMNGRNLERGRIIYHAAGCITCHYHNGEGTEVGPDLTHVGFRLSREKILESILEPNKVIGDPYSAYSLKLINGKKLNGRILCQTGEKYQFLPDPVKPGEWNDIQMTDVESVIKSTVSIMPEGLLVLCDREEVLDLLAYLLEDRDPRDRFFRKQSDVKPVSVNVDK